ncbi:hypothetical protein JVT61DRAFT_11745 [Boletus reticuloceps]|uniref:Uncharacterized protein n=1 Tax=Boletus reticuloceps TaxID=495285 RepID=A0A8I2YW72_9AGAM|nr:hypothetical protein JVT61DRAFT_11745 [Boletus reticuloceps]
MSIMLPYGQTVARITALVFLWWGIHASSVELLSYIYIDGLPHDTVWSPDSFELVAASSYTQTAVDNVFTGEPYLNPEPLCHAVKSDPIAPWLPLASVSRHWHSLTRTIPSISEKRPVDKPRFFHILCDMLLPELYRWRFFHVQVALHREMRDILNALFETGISVATQLISVTLICRSASNLKTIALVEVSVDWNQAGSPLNPTSQRSKSCSVAPKKMSHPGTAFATVLQGAAQ